MCMQLIDLIYQAIQSIPKPLDQIMLSPPINKPKETSSSTDFSRSSSTSNFAQGNTDKKQATWLALYALNL